MKLSNKKGLWMFTRNGTLGQGSGGAKKGSSVATAHKKLSASEKFKRAQMNDKQIDRTELQDVFNDELAKLMKAASKRKGGGEVSTSTQAALEAIAQKSAKKLFKQQKKEKERYEIRGKYFTGMQGGRIETNGKIFDAAGQHILTVDKATGKIKNVWGNVVGKYKPNCSFSEYKVAKLIEKYDSRLKKGGVGGLWAGTQGHGSTGGGIWGAPSSPASDAGNIWGSGGGNIWGTD